MRWFSFALVLLSLQAFAAPADMPAARQQSQFLIQQAYIKYPAIPAGFLESQAWAATRWQHRIPDEADTHHGMPATYGLFGLYGTDAGNFSDVLGEVATMSGLSREELLASESVYVDAVAQFVDTRIRDFGLVGQPLEAMRPVAEVLSGIRANSEATRYAVTSHVYEVYRAAGKGIDLGVVQVAPQAVDLRKVFSQAELDKLNAKELVFAADGKVVVESEAKKKSSASFDAGSSAAADQVNVDYPGATWNEAYGFSSRSGAEITHVVVHTMQGSYAGSIAWFLDPVSQVSSHYLMRSSDGQITQMVRHIDKAWHARSANPYSIGIEHEGYVDNPDWYTDTMYNESAKLVAYICNMHPVNCAMTYDGPSHDTLFELDSSYTVKGHQHYPDQSHTDPGINWDWPRYYSLINGGVIPPAVNILPEATFTWNCTGLTCAFDATASMDADGSIVSFDWGFGAGATASSSMPSHTYAAAGDYRVDLAVTDDKGAVHTTWRSIRVSRPAPPPSSGGGGAVGPWLLLVFALLVGCSRAQEANLAMPDLGDADYYWIASRIFENETNGKMQYLTHWNDGEDFPSMGIGHFIWFPEGVDAPFDESFPTMLAYLREHEDECAPVPNWLAGPAVPAAPWPDKASFDEAYDSERVASLRSWLARSAPQQAQYIVASFNARWNALELEEGDKAELTALLQRLLSTSRGLFAVVDYYNFKGLGSNPRERYAGEGWGLVQVLRDMPSGISDDGDLVTEFSKSASNRLALRVENSPPERNEGRWLDGWHRRTAAYAGRTPPLSAPAETAFRVAPYVQSVAADKATITWFSEHGTSGTATVAGNDDPAELVIKGPEQACELAYHLAEFRDLEAARFPPYFHEVSLTGLAPGRTYVVDVIQDGQAATVNVRTPNADSVHFVVYGDSETEPESHGEFVKWPSRVDATDSERRYPVDQATGYEANLAAIAAKAPDFVAIAGDLVESGGEQRDWDEFWQVNAKLAASIPIVPALGNHDYYGGPGDLGGYGSEGTARAYAKFRRYFARPPYYSLEQGPIALIVIDGNNAGSERSALDTNWYLDGTAPGLDESSDQMQWLEAELARAQREKAFTFVMFHAAPYTSGVHGRTPGTGEGENFASGRPLQQLTPLFLRYGVDAVFNGHDEMYEHSTVSGFEELEDGTQAEHTVHYFVVGIGGDGLRGPDHLVPNPQRVFLAHEDSTEVWSDDGVLLDGGKHYGHLDIRVSQESDGTWQAQFKPVYLFPVMNEAGEVQSFEPRTYDDELRLVNKRVH